MGVYSCLSIDSILCLQAYKIGYKRCTQYALPSYKVYTVHTLSVRIQDSYKVYTLHSLVLLRRGEPGIFYHVRDVKGRHDLIMRGWTKLGPSGSVSDTLRIYYTLRFTTAVSSGV